MSSSNNNIVYTLVGLSALLFVIQKLAGASEVVENFGMLPKQTVRVERVAQSPQTGDFVDIPGTYQSILSPHDTAGMVDYGALIRYNMPNKKHLGNSRGYADMIPSSTQEGYCGSCGVEGYCGGGACNSAGCRPNGGSHGPTTTKTSNIVPSGFAAGDYAQKYSELNYSTPTDMLPVQHMGEGAPNALGEATVQPIIYDRYIYANQKDRLNAAGDPIRGDLPITPHQQGWFTPSANPQTALRDSALVVMGGADNDTTKELMAMKTALSGGSVDTGSGVNYSVQKSSFASSTGGVHVTSFP